MQRLALFCVGCALWASLFLSAGCRQEAQSARETLLPVKIATLKKSRPGLTMRLTGAARAWREESLSFEIGGKILEVLEEDTDVRLESRSDKDGNVAIEGEVLAELDSARYDADVQAAEAQLESALAQVEAIRETIQQVIPQDVKSAKARVEAIDISLQQILTQHEQRAKTEMDRAKRELNRTQALYEKDSESQKYFEEARSRYEVAQASYLEAQAAISYQEREREAAQAESAKATASLFVKQAELQSAQGSVKMARALLTVALRNQKECRLRTPFAGVVKARLVGKGAVVTPAQPVIKVTAMDPILVDVGVSSETARSIQAGDPVAVFPPSLGGESVSGWVHQKAVAADPGTRTYNITCIVRNQVITPRGGSYPLDSRIEKGNSDTVWLLDHSRPESGLMLWNESIFQEGTGHFAWVIQEFELGRDKVNFQNAPVRKIRVEVEDGLVEFMRRRYRKVRVHPELRPGMITLRKGFPNLRDGARLTYVPIDWMMHPGDLAPVSFDVGECREGVYVPMRAILEDPDGYCLFLYDRENKAAERIRIRVKEAFRDTRLVESDCELEGRDLIVVGAHYLKDRDRVAAVRMEVQR